MKVNITYNDIIKSIADVARYVELEDEWFCAAKAIPSAYMAESSGKNFQASNIRKLDKGQNCKRDRIGILQESNMLNYKRKNRITKRKIKVRWSVAFASACFSCIRFLFSSNVMKSTLENVFYDCRHYYDGL